MSRNSSSAYVVKVQKPLSVFTPHLEYLVYDRSRRRLKLVPESDVPHYVLKALETEPKIYMIAEWDDLDESWNLNGKLMKPQSW